MKDKTRIIHLLLLICVMIAAYTPALAQNTPPQANGGRIGVVRGVGTTLLDMNGGQPAEVLAAGALVFVLGRSADSSLLMVQTEAGVTGWVSASALLVVDVAKLPVVDLPTASEPSANSEAIDASDTLTTTGKNDNPATNRRRTQSNHTTNRQPRQPQRYRPPVQSQPRCRSARSTCAVVQAQPIQGGNDNPLEHTVARDWAQSNRRLGAVGN